MKRFIKWLFLRFVWDSEANGKWTPDVQIESMRAELHDRSFDASANLKMNGPAMLWFGDMLKILTTGAPNYLSMVAVTKDGEYTVTIRKPHGKTPEQRVTELTAEVNRLSLLVEQPPSIESK